MQTPRRGHCKRLAAVNANASQRPDAAQVVTVNHSRYVPLATHAPSAWTSSENLFGPANCQQALFASHIAAIQVSHPCRKFN